jgi:hypothetical protein
MLDRMRMLAAAPAAIAFPVSGALSAAPSAAARVDLCVMSPPRHPQCVPIRRCLRLAAKSAHRRRADAAAGIDREAGVRWNGRRWV